jgi:hypothetical protein
LKSSKQFRNNARDARPEADHLSHRKSHPEHPDFPKPGIQFKDITPVLADARLFAASIDMLTADFQAGMVDAVVGIDARGLSSRRRPLSNFRRASSLCAKRASFPLIRTNRVTNSNTAPTQSRSTPMP